MNNLWRLIIPAIGGFFRPHKNNRQINAVKCWKYGQEGHILRDCRSEQTHRQNRPSVGHGRGWSRSSKQPGVHEKLGGSLQKEVTVESYNNSNKNNISTYRVNVSGNPNSCIVFIGKQKFRSLVDTGAECSLMHRRVYDNLKNKPKLLKKSVN